MTFKSFKGLFTPKKPKVESTEEYQKWREMIFTIPPEASGVSRSDANRVYGVIMDIGQLDARTSTPWAISLNAFLRGDTAFHATVGTAVIGLDREPQVAQVADEIVQIAQGLLPKTNPAQDDSLPEPGMVQFFFFTTNGLRVVEGHLDSFQKPESSFLPLLERFRIIRQFADQIMEERHKPNIKALYVAAFTPEELDRDKLTPLVFFAIDRFKTTNPTFNRRIEQMPSKTPIEMVSIKHFPNTHTFSSMQTSMKSVLNNNKVAFNPTPDDTFFVHGMTDHQRREHIFLFYFDMEWSYQAPTG